MKCFVSRTTRTCANIKEKIVKIMMMMMIIIIIIIIIIITTTIIIIRTIAVIMTMIRM